MCIEDDDKYMLPNGSSSLPMSGVMPSFGYKVPLFIKRPLTRKLRQIPGVPSPSNAPDDLVSEPKS